MKKEWLNPEVKNLGLQFTKEEKIFECGNPIGNYQLCPYNNVFCKYSETDSARPYPDSEVSEDKSCINLFIRCTVSVAKPEIS